MSWIYDGDTVAVETADGEIDVRLLGVNAPEDGECFDDESRDHLIETLKGRDVHLEVHDIDQFGRTLAVVWDGERDVNLELVSLGLAIATTPETGDPDFTAAESRAAAEGLGLWAKDACGGGPIPEIVIDQTESVADAPGPDDENLNEELVAIRNEGDKKVSLNGWVLRDESSRHRFTFPAGTQIEADETLTISSENPGWDPGGSPVWNNDGDIVILLDRQGRVVDYWRYGPAKP